MGLVFLHARPIEHEVHGPCRMEIWRGDSRYVVEFYRNGQLIEREESNGLGYESRKGATDAPRRARCGATADIQRERTEDGQMLEMR